MRSLQLSLIGYFVALLALALGTASLLFYRNTQETLEAKQTATAALLEASYAQDCERERARLDEALLYQARTLAQLVQYHIDWDRLRNWDLHGLGLLMAMQSPNAYVVTPLWVAEGTRGPFSGELYRVMMSKLKTEIKLKNSDLLRYVDDQVAEYFQINSAWNTTYHSQSVTRALGKDGFPVNPRVFGQDSVLDWDYDDFPMGPDQKVRRVMLKAPAAARYIPLGPPPPRKFGWGQSAPRSAPSGSPSGSPWRRDQVTRPAIFVQCACDTSKRDAAISLHKATLDSELAAMEVENEATLATLRQRLVLVNLGTFLATMIGTCVLVRHGLFPLRRLSEAVSQVSARDFRLPFGERRLPAELSPIVSHLNQTLEQLKRAFVREKQAAADISHDLRTPLSALLTTIEVTLRKPRHADEYREALEDCRDSAQHISEAVERLLALARLDAGVDTLRLQAVDATKLASQCVAMVRPLAEARGLKLELHGGEAVPLQSDPEKLREILTNLLHNAIQYNRPNGSIDVSVGRINGHVHLQVRDTGVGISDQARNHIFERFYREDPSRQADGMHAGLGLAIVKGYVDLMGGHIEVQSKVGQGSTFEVQLPA